MEIRITDEDSGSSLELDRLSGLAQTALQEERTPEEAELSLAIVGPERMAELNQAYLGREGPTDVMAFPMDEEAGQEGGMLLGDVVICPQEVQDRLEIYGVAAGEELAYVLVHGILHLLGYRHASEKGNREMDDRVRQILKKYAERKD